LIWLKKFRAALCRFACRGRWVGLRGPLHFRNGCLRDVIFRNIRSTANFYSDSHAALNQCGIHLLF
jgi:hypothetical protein